MLIEEALHLDIRLRGNEVRQWRRERPEGPQYFFPLIEGSAVASGNRDGRDAIRGGEQQRNGGHFIRAGARKFIVESKDILGLCHGVKDQAPQHWAYRMQLIVRRSDDAKIGPRARHAPE